MSKLQRNKLLIFLLALHITVAPVFYLTPKVTAAPLSNRSIKVFSPLASVTTQHQANFTIPTAGTVGSIELEYCANDPFIGAPCTVPGGLNLAGATISSQTGATGFTIHPLTTANKLVISRVPAPTLAFQPVSYTFDNIVNPSTVDATTFVRISTFASDDGSGPRTDSGAAVFGITRGIAVEAFVPPYLTFCAGITVSSNCNSVSGSAIDLGELSKTKANFSTSQFAVATNDFTGYSVFLAGITMTSGNNIIPPLSTSQSSIPGNSQFGINLVDNSNPQVGSNPTGTGTAAAQSGFSTPNKFKFANEAIAASSRATNFNTFTISYLVNVSPSQRAGTYSATLTYIATASF